MTTQQTLFNKISKDPDLLHREVLAFLTQEQGKSNPQKKKVIQELLKALQSNKLPTEKQKLILHYSLARTWL